MRLPFSCGEANMFSRLRAARYGSDDSNRRPLAPDSASSIPRTGYDEPLVDTGPNLVLDLADVPFIDTIGLSAVLDTRRAALDHGGTFAIRNPSSAVRRMLDVTGLAEAFNPNPD
jgi:hypothetical protein